MRASGSGRWVPRSFAAALGVALLALCTACEMSVNPATGRSEVFVLSEAEEQKLEERLAAEVERDLGLVRDPALAAYVGRLGARLARHSPRPDLEYRFQLVEADEPNAFALPAGRVYATRGLLVLANSEAELANVLCHEIAHVAARHAAQRHAHEISFGLATLLGNLASGGGPFEDAGSESIGGPSGSWAYARNQEREADRLGQELAIRAGIDPRGMAAFLGSLEREERRRHGFASSHSYGSTHPGALARVAEATSRAEIERLRRIPAAGPPRAEFLARIEGMAVERPVAEGGFVGTRLLHPELGFSARFPVGWKRVRRGHGILAISPERDALVMLEQRGDGADPEAAARADARQEKLRLIHATSARVGGLPAFRAKALIETPQGAVDAELTWIAFDGRVHRLAAGMKVGRLARHEGTFRAFTSSFRKLVPEDLSRLSELRLRIAVARRGESLGDLARRTGNEWEVDRTAVANALVGTDRLEEGQLVKVAVREPYRPGSR